MRKQRKVKYPSKTTLNLVMKERPKHYYPVLTAAVILFCAALAVFTKYGVVDQLMKENHVWNEVYARENNLNMLKVENKDYEAIQAEYDKYFPNNPALGTMVDVEDVLRIVNTRLLKKATTQSLQFRNNTLTIVLAGIDLNEASKLMDELYEKEELVNTVDFYGASTSDKGEPSINMVITFHVEQEASQ